MSEHHNKFDKDLSEPLNPRREGKYELTPKELSEWMVCTNCYPPEKIYQVATSNLSHEEQLQRKVEQDEAKRAAPEALKQLTKWGGQKGLMDKLNANMVHGLDDAQVEASRKFYGDNKPLPRETKSVCDMIMENLGDAFIILLIVAACVELVLGIWQEGWGHGWVDGASIFFAVGLITTVNVCNSYQTEQTFKKLMAKQDDNKVNVTRNSTDAEIHVDELVVGDIVQCDNSLKIRADGIMITSADMKTNESDLTGEKDELQKFPYEMKGDEAEGKPFAFKGTIVTYGSGKMLVCNVGTRTNEGQMERQMDFGDGETPLQRKLNSIVIWIGKIGIVSAALVFLALTLRLVFDIWAFGSRDLADKQNLTDITGAFIVAVTVVVMAIPEGLPLAVTIALQFSLAQLSNVYHALVLKPDATEVMGGCTEICSDKTGTLTQNSMTTMALWIESEFYDEYDARDAGKGTQHGVVKQLGSMSDIADAILINSSARYSTNTKTNITSLGGNPTELGLFNYLIECGYDMSNQHKDELVKMRIFETPFDSKKKFSTVAYRRADGTVRVVLKGAPDFVSKRCTKLEKSHGNIVDVSEREVEAIMGPQVISKFASKCYRTILTAYKDFTAEDWASYVENNDVESKDEATFTSAREGLECGLTISAIFGIEDPLRDNIKETIARLRSAGVRTRMCTGDNVETARSICEKAGIIVDAKDETDPEIIEKLKDPMFVENRKKYECMTGEEFRKEFGRKTEDDLWEANPRAFHWKTMIIPHLKCLARSSPTDKQILVQGIQNYSEIKAIVAVTGDGTNDCPALKRADVGFAMMTGSDAAKTASKVILTTDDFNSTLVCVKFGRNIYDSVQKFLQFQLTVNVVAIFIVLLGAVVLNEKVLTSVQILWVNLIMDTFAALALATEPATESLLDRAPTRAEESIVSNVMARNILGWSVYQIAVLCVVLFTGQEMFDLKFRAEDPFYWNCEQTFCEERTENNPFGGVDDQTQVIDLATGVVGIAHEQTDKVMMYTMIFNLFVWLQVFNQFNARKIADKSWNVFSGLTQNCWFIGITFVTILTQIAVVQWLGRPLRTTPLTWEQQLFTIGLSAGIIPWNLIQTALLKKEWFGWASDCVPNEEVDEDEEGEQSAVIALSGRASTRMAAALKKKVQQAVEQQRLSTKMNPSIN